LVQKLREGARAFESGAVAASWAPEEYPKTADAVLDSYDLDTSIIHAIQERFQDAERAKPVLAVYRGSYQKDLIKYVHAGDAKTLERELRLWNPFARPKETHNLVRAIIADRHAAMLASHAARDAALNVARGGAAPREDVDVRPADVAREGGSDMQAGQPEDVPAEVQPVAETVHVDPMPKDQGAEAAPGQPRTLEVLLDEFSGRVVARGERDGVRWERDALGVVVWTHSDGSRHVDIPDRLGWSFAASSPARAREAQTHAVSAPGGVHASEVHTSSTEVVAHAESTEVAGSYADHLAAIRRASGVSHEQMEKHGSRWQRIQTAIKERFMRVLVSKLGAMMGGITAGLFCMPFLPSLALIGGGALLGNWLLNRHYRDIGYTEGYATRVGAVHRLARMREKMEQLEPGSFAKKYPTEEAVKKKLDSMVFMRNLMANTLIAAGSGYVGLEARTGGKFGSTVVDSMRSGNWDSFWQLFACDGGARGRLLPWTSSEGAGNGGATTGAFEHARPRGMGLFGIQPHIGERGSLFEGQLVTGGTRPFTLGTAHPRVAECWRPILGSGAYLTPSGDGVHTTLHYRPGWIARG
jgi:hypothetical protein